VAVLSCWAAYDPLGTVHTTVFVARQCVTRKPVHVVIRSVAFGLQPVIASSPRALAGPWHPGFPLQPCCVDGPARCWHFNQGRIDSLMRHISMLTQQSPAVTAEHPAVMRSHHCHNACPTEELLHRCLSMIWKHRSRCCRGCHRLCAQAAAELPRCGQH
jgi:hypothetical protein